MKTELEWFQKYNYILKMQQIKNMKLGIVGSGMIIWDFLTITPYLNKIELTAICYTKRSEVVGKDLTSKYNIKNMFSNYDKFLSFGPKFSRGTLMDLNIYNIHYVVGLFGKPKNVEYYPNMERGIDTSGILILDYETFKCTCVRAKDCKASIANNIQGDKGCIYQNTPTNVCMNFEVLMNDGTSSLINENNYEHRMVNEFIQFEDMIKNNRLEECYQMLEHSLIVCEVQTIARNKGGIVFPADIEII